MTWEEVWGKENSQEFRKKYPDISVMIDTLSELVSIFPIPKDADVYFSQLLSESWRQGLINDTEQGVISEALRPYLAPLEELRLNKPKRVKGIEKNQMSPEKLREFASQLQPGEVVELTFRQDPLSSRLNVDAMFSLRILLSTGGENIILQNDRIGLMAVLASNEWDRVSPSVRATIKDTFDPEWFAGRFGKGIERVRVVPR